MLEHSHVAVTVARIWKKLLGLSEVPYKASFVDLGGDSLLLNSMLVEIESQLDVYLEAEDILDDLTVTGITAAILLKTTEEGSEEQRA